MSLPHKAQPDGFSIWHSRHGLKWCWRQVKKVEESKNAGHVVERSGLRTRPEALQDIRDELARRERVAAAANPPNDQAAAATGARGT